MTEERPCDTCRWACHKLFSLVLAILGVGRQSSSQMG